MSYGPDDDGSYGDRAIKSKRRREMEVWSLLQDLGGGSLHRAYGYVKLHGSLRVAGLTFPRFREYVDGFEDMGLLETHEERDQKGRFSGENYRLAEEGAGRPDDRKVNGGEGEA